MKSLIFLLIILILGLLLRILFINSNPPSLYGDELTITLDAYSLLKTGHDQLGNFLPLTFPMGAGRPAGYVYASIPFVALFGPTSLGVRTLSILSGLGIILLMYFIGKRLFSRKAGLAAAFISSVSIWDISLSRGGFEAHFALFLAVLGFYLFLKAKENPLLYIFSATSFGLTLHTYPTYKITLLLFLPLLFWFVEAKAREIKNKYILVSLFVLILLGSLALSQTFVGGSETRFSNINIFSQDKLKTIIEEKINFERSISKLPNDIAKYFHNKPVEYVKVLGENYLQNFSFDFLFIHGDRNPRHNMATMGEFYFVEMALMLIGVISFWYKEKRTIKFIIFWILLTPIPTAMVDLPHALRSAFMLPPLVILSSLGLTTLINKKNKLLLLSFFLFFAIQFTFFTQKLYFLSPYVYSSFWSYSAKLATDIAQKERGKFEYVFLSDRIDNIEFAYPIYSKIDPKDVISQNKKKNSMKDYNFKKFDNVYIGYIPDSEIDKSLQSLNSSVLYIGPKEDGRATERYEVVYGLDRSSALIIKELGTQ